MKVPTQLATGYAFKSPECVINGVKSSSIFVGAKSTSIEQLNALQNSSLSLLYSSMSMQINITEAFATQKR